MKLIEALRKVGGPASEAARTFELLAIAERELRGVPKSIGNAVFGALAPPPGMSRLSDEVYRAHARELVERAQRGASLEIGTDAELLMALSEASLRAPPDAGHAAAFERLFERVMGRRVDGEPTRESWPGEIDQILSALRARVRVAGR